MIHVAERADILHFIINARFHRKNDSPVYPMGYELKTEFYIFVEINVLYELYY